jgi:isopentenyl phosphate kinase
MKKLALIKIGGGLITDKSKPLSVREDMMRILAEGLREAHAALPENAFIVGNGAGSFGHYLASKESSDTAEERITAIHESVVLLNKLFVGQLIKIGLPANSIIPSDYIVAENGKLKDFDMQEVEGVLSLNSIPVLFGDIVDDGTPRGMIFSTEMLFEVLVERLHANYEINVIYAGETEGVLDKEGATIPEISQETWKSMGGVIEAPKGYDVTGGMKHKIESALHVAAYAKNVRIISGKDPHTITAALSGAAVGTKITR